MGAASLHMQLKVSSLSEVFSFEELLNKYRGELSPDCKKYWAEFNERIGRSHELDLEHTRVDRMLAIHPLCEWIYFSNCCSFEAMLLG